MSAGQTHAVDACRPDDTVTFFEEAAVTVMEPTANAAPPSPSMPARMAAALGLGAALAKTTKSTVAASFNHTSSVMLKSVTLGARG